jgi:hypothetical protein
MFTWLKKWFEKKPPLIDLSIEMPDGSPREMVYATSDGRALFVRFFFPQTLAIYPRMVEELDTKRRESLKEWGEVRTALEAMADRLLAEGENTAQKELNRREAERLRNEAKNLSMPDRPGWSAAYDILHSLEREEAETLLKHGVVLLETKKEATKTSSTTFRYLVRFNSRIGVVIAAGFSTHITEAVHEMNNAELELIARQQT